MTPPLTLEHRRILDCVGVRECIPDGSRAAAVDYLVHAGLVMTSKGSDWAGLTEKGLEALKHARIYGWGGVGTHT